MMLSIIIRSLIELNPQFFFIIGLFRKSIDFTDTICGKSIAFQTEVLAFLKTLEKNEYVTCIGFSLEQNFFGCFGQLLAISRPPCNDAS